MQPSETERGKKRLEQFILESIRLDALLDARALDIEFVKDGGELLYTPDSSTWNSLFFPVSEGQEHSGNNGSIPGFSEVYLETDRTEAPYIPDSPLTGKQATGMLGKVLMDTIFVSQNGNRQVPQFFLTEESKQGLNEAIKTVIISRNKRSRNSKEQKSILTLLSALKSEFASADNDEKTENLFLRAPNSLSRAGALSAFLDDANFVNLIDRVRTYNEVSFIDWAYIEAMVDEGNSDEKTFHFGKSDVREFERLKIDFVSTFQKELPRSAISKISSLSEILALNYIVGGTRGNRKRIVYLTNAQWAIRDFDRFVWDEHSENPLRLAQASDRLRTVSSLFVRNPLCFLHDIELRPEDGEARGALKVFMDSVVPRKLHDEKRLDTSAQKRSLIIKALDDLETKGQLNAYLDELSKFYDRWAYKKVPWVNEFLAQRAQHWAEGLQLFSEEGFYSFWRKVNRDFTRLSWQFGIYLAIMTEGLPARAAPLVFIDCDTKTNAVLSALQAVLARGDIEGFRDQIDEFLSRPLERQSEERKEYFDALVNAVLFLFSSQFETSKLHTETACELAMKSTDPDVTGREAYYLRSYLVRVTAANRLDLENARKLMLIARSKLELDNAVLVQGSRISTIRFDLEDWSRRIVSALADYFDQGQSREFSAHHMREYLTFVRRSTSANFNDLSLHESNALQRQICERMRFNFLVISVTMDEFNTLNKGTSRGFLESVISEWNLVFGSVHKDLEIAVDEETLSRASTIEEAYLVALMAGVLDADFIQRDLNARECVSQTFGEMNRESLKSAETSFVDKERYRRLEQYSVARLDGLRAKK
jgi:hypothetical protein